MPLIIIITTTVYVVAILWAWKSMVDIEKTKKVAVILIGLVFTYFITWITFSISSKGISYVNEEILSSISKSIVPIFTGINSIVVLPYIGRLLDKVNEGEIEKDTFSKRILTIIIILLIILWLECGYMRDTQEGILQIYNSMK